MKHTITSNLAPKVVGPYSQAVKVGSHLFVSGQIGIDPTTSIMIAGDVAAQTIRVMANLTAVLAEANLTFDHVVKTTIYLTDMAAFAAVNEIYGAYFSEPFPARATIGVKSLPKDALIEIDCIAAYD